jgi:DNA-binding MarR family transcriptional regulator
VNDALYQRLVHAYGQATRILDPIRFSLYDERGLTMPQLRVLFMLAENAERPAGDLAQELGVSPSTVTGITDRLARQGLIVRKEDPRDRRVVLLALSDEGILLTGEVAESAKAQLRRVFEAMADERLETLAACLEELGAADASLRAQEAVSSPA